MATLLERRLRLASALLALFYQALGNQQERTVNGRKSHTVRELACHLVHLEELGIDGFHVLHHLFCIAEERCPHDIVSPEFSLRQIAFVG